MSRHIDERFMHLSLRGLTYQHVVLYVSFCISWIFLLSCNASLLLLVAIQLFFTQLELAIQGFRLQAMIEHGWRPTFILFSVFVLGLFLANILLMFMLPVILLLSFPCCLTIIFSLASGEHFTLYMSINLFLLKVCMHHCFIMGLLAGVLLPSFFWLLQYFFWPILKLQSYSCKQLGFIELQYLT